MDYTALLEPYKENGRTVGGQIKWLAKQGIPQPSIDFAISSIYKKIELGLKFENGDALDQTLRQVAKVHEAKLLEEQMKLRIGEIANNLDVDWNKLTKWQKIKQVITGEA